MVRSVTSWALLIFGSALTGHGISLYFTAEQEQERARLKWLSVKPSRPEAENEWDSGVVARISFDRLRREVFVYGDENPANLKKGPVWLRMTRSFAAQGNTVVAGHRDTHFRFLKDARVGDVFRVDDAVIHRTYRIKEMRVVRPEDRSLLAPEAKKVITLVTCYPFYMVGRANRRMIVRAELVSKIAAPDRVN